MPTPALTAAVHGVPPAAGFTVEVAYSPRAGEVEVVAVHVAASATVADALRASGLLRKHGLDEATVRAGVWCNSVNFPKGGWPGEPAGAQRCQHPNEPPAPVPYV